MGKQRNFFADIIRGVAVFLMLWGHCVQYCIAGTELDFFENSVFRFIYSFHMPLFMLISGYFFFFSFSKRELHILLKYRTQSLIQPIVFCSFFNYLVTTVPYTMRRGDYFAIFNGRWMGNLSSLWFLWSVLAASLIITVICKKINNPAGQVVLLIAASPVVTIFPNAELNLFMYPYFVIGFYFAKYKDTLLFRIYKLKYLSFVLFPVLLCFFEKKHYIYTTGLFANSSYNAHQMLLIDAYRWAIGLVGSVFMITVLQFIYHNISLKVKKPWLSIGLSKMGQKSLQIYAFSVAFLSFYLSHYFLRLLSILNIDNIFAENMMIYNYVFTPILAIGYAFALYFVVIIFEKMKVSRIMFGK